MVAPPSHVGYPAIAGELHGDGGEEKKSFDYPTLSASSSADNNIVYWLSLTVVANV